MRVRKSVRVFLRERAAGWCEYCRFPDEFSQLPFVPDHVHALQHHGPTDPDNLAWCCGFCNRSKGPNVAGIDPDTRNVVAIFNPRRQRWKDHFKWRDAEIVAKTPTGRVTIIALKLNDPEQLRRRKALIENGWWQPS